jgi:hypothetical protein
MTIEEVVRQVLREDGCLATEIMDQLSPATQRFSSSPRSSRR